MQRKTIIVSQKLAAGTAGRISWAPLGSGERWRLVGVTEIPDVSVAANATDYITRALFKGSTAIQTAVTTASTGLTQGTPVALVLTGVGSDLEITHTNPLTYRITHAGAGKAVEVSVVAEFEVERV